jgi:hypothetical protein
MDMRRRKVIQETLREREKTHGDYMEQSRLTQTLFNELMASRNGPTLPAFQREALHMICAKISRLMTGDNMEPEHWHDIAGYALLAERCMKREQFSTQERP